MDLHQPLIEWGEVDVADLRAAVLDLTPNDWAGDRRSRAGLAGGRAGDAIYLYNDQPAPFGRCTLTEAQETGVVHVLRAAEHPLFAVVDEVVLRAIAPRYSGCDVLRVQLADLPAGASIGRHRDTGILAAVHRLHVPIVTNPNVRFLIGDGAFNLAAGTLYELNNVAWHAVENGGASGRVHLLVDLLPHATGRAACHDDRRTLAAALVRTKAGSVQLG